MRCRCEGAASSIELGLESAQRTRHAAAGPEPAAAVGVTPCRSLSPLAATRIRPQRRNEACFSGPGVLPGEQEAGRVEYKLRLLNPTPARFQQLVSWVGRAARLVALLRESGWAPLNATCVHNVAS